MNHPSAMAPTATPGSSPAIFHGVGQCQGRRCRSVRADCSPCVDRLGAPLSFHHVEFWCADGRRSVRRGPLLLRAVGALHGELRARLPPAALRLRLPHALIHVDHVVGNDPELAPPVRAYVAGFTGFHEFAEFTAEDVGTAESGLNSVVLANASESVLLALAEPVHGTRRRSQVQAYLDHHGGAGVQHVALASDDILGTLREMRARAGPTMGGFEFLPPSPPSYYDDVRRRAGDVLSAAQINECQELGVLVDRDDHGVLLQIFTKPVGDRLTFFLEIIQRIGCMEKDKHGQEYQRGGCGGFGKANFSHLYKSIEDYERSLEAKQAHKSKGQECDPVWFS